QARLLLSPKGGLVDPRLRALNEHIPIVRVPRAGGRPGYPSLPTRCASTEDHQPSSRREARRHPCPPPAKEGVPREETERGMGCVRREALGVAGSAEREARHGKSRAGWPDRIFNQRDLKDLRK
ncbi:MAG: hypothetical protein Q8L77_05690, partial [Nitrospirota bacterium]|nr:hypothetical protein [Nitrospirota bacterium]